MSAEWPADRLLLWLGGGFAALSFDWRQGGLRIGRRRCGRLGERRICRRTGRGGRHAGAHRLLLVLDILGQLFKTAETGFELVERVVEGLDLAGDLIDLGALRFLLGLHLLLYGVQIGGHLVDGVGALLDEVLHDAHAFVVGLLQPGDGVLQDPVSGSGAAPYPC